MKKVLTSSLILIMSIALILGGCSSGSGSNTNTTNPAINSESANNPDNSGSETAEEEPAFEFAAEGVSGEVEIWSFVKETAEIVDAFNKAYPNIKVTFVDTGWDVHDKLATAVAAGTGAPDVAMIEQGQFNRYVTGDVLEDLLQPPYDAGRFRDDVSDYNWDRWRSLNGKKLLGMPWDVTPGVLYYRSDIYEQLGLPSDPEELGQFMEDPENVFLIAETLKADGKYFMEWGDGPIHWGGDEVGYFDTELKWTRNTDRLVELLDFTKRGDQIGWAAWVGAGSDDGKAMVSKGELTGMVRGSWGARGLANDFPDLAGKWRATKLPFGIAAGMGGSTFVLPSQSKNKEAAWAFIEWASRSEEAWNIWAKHSIQPGWKSIQSLDWYINHTNEYLGGQKDYAMYQQIEPLIPSRLLTPLDGPSWPIWLNSVKEEGLFKNLDSRAILQQAQENVESQLKSEIEALRSEFE
ncbi:ABC transporter substrate-binding protein [Paenibacillus tarimensis]